MFFLESHLSLTSTPPQSLATLLDSDAIPWKTVLLAFSLGEFAWESYLSYRQYKWLCVREPPAVLKDEVSQEKFERSQVITSPPTSRITPLPPNARFGFVDSLYDRLQTLAYIHYDVLPAMWALAGRLISRWLPARVLGVSTAGEIPQSLVFLFLQNVLGTLLSLPPAYYRTFVLEERFGFNKQTHSLFLSDLAKSQLLSIILGGPIAAGLLAIIRGAGAHFFYHVWLFVAAVQVAAITVYPVLIQPLFNTLSPLPAGALRDGVEALAARLRFPLRGLYVIDGSRRSSHSNAYFYGLPWKKHVVLYDTLIEKSEPAEVVAVLGHELGHWTCSHTTKLMLVGQAHVLFIFALFSAFVRNAALYAAFGFPDPRERPVIVGLTLFWGMLVPIDSFVTLGMNSLTRRFEYQADAFARDLGYAAELASGLIKLQTQNLSSFYADWMYSAYHYSHPSLLERLAALGWEGKKGREEETEEKPAVVKAGDREL
ncbi:hypothetical protein KEM52_003262 [Ascosphaera acerosa]|nr:hypothetical protein KEM52_003262 [Ascosphaera acerosa]